MGWVLVLLAALLEVVWASGLKYAETTVEWIMIVSLIAVSFMLLIRAYKSIPVAVGYTVFVGIGTVGTYLVGIFLGEAFSVSQVLFLFILLIGIVGMKLTTTENSHS
ncbi:hypothetical protein JQN58_07645 [Aneurinibacillus sp. BA2021]|nr:hypothetical protein [Aneurinibacillus sp. BA2021]